MARSVLFKSSARVYNLRFLFLANLATLVLLILAAVQPANTYTKSIIAVGIAIMHRLFRTCLSRNTDYFVGLWKVWQHLIWQRLQPRLVVYFQVMLLIPNGPSSRPLGLAGIPSMLVLLALLLSAVFRIATVIKTKNGIWQRFEFLGCCTRAHPPYTHLSILLNRSVACPLVRGESQAIILVRAVVLSCIVLGVPALGVYLVVVVPLHAQIYTRSSGRFGGDRTPPGNATLVVNLFRDAPFGDVNRVYATSWDEAHPDGVNCSVTPLALPKFAGLTEAQGPFSWWTTTQVSISIAFPSNTGGVYVWPVQGDISQDVLPPFWRNILDRETNDKLTFCGTLKKTVNASALSGVATFGGFWTFLNGIFALLFGANVVYFTLGTFHRSFCGGRRPLSALGAVRVFQWRTLVRRYHDVHQEDNIQQLFPDRKRAIEKYRW
ncbi:hypothetical protein DFH09DRAFT_1091742 [Mycena vulgaris]|nr:hypothetical protein DFH09DRAFT_1091742 [Mycena vulgaris]